MILFFFCKNVYFYLTALWFAFSSGFSGRTLYDQLSLALLNVLFSAVKPFMLEIIFTPFSEKELPAQPMNYKTLQKSTFTNTVSHFQI